MKSRRASTRTLNKIISMLVVWVFLFNTIPVSGLQENSSSTLAPELSTARPDSKENMAIAAGAVSHTALNAHIKNEVEKLIAAKGEAWINELVDKDQPIPISDIVKITGYFAHVGLGRQYGKPVMYVDRDIYNNTRDSAVVISHESFEIEKWEGIRKKLNIDARDMRAWIVKNLNSIVIELKGTEYEGKTVRETALIIHNAAPSVNHLYERYGLKNKVDARYLIELLNRYDVSNLHYESDAIVDPNTSNDIVISANKKNSPGDRRVTSSKRLLSIARSLMQRPKGAKTWIKEHVPELLGRKLLSISLEGNMPEFARWPRIQDANTKGGLGAYYGDLVEGMDKIGMDASFVQPGYMFDKNGEYIDYNYLVKESALEEVNFAEDVAVWTWISEDFSLNNLINGESMIDGKKSREFFKDWCAIQRDGNALIKIKFYRIVREGSARYIAVSPVFDKLYTDDRYHRYSQEICLGKGVYQFSKKMGLIPDILHLNEGHTVVAAAEMKNDPIFDNMATVVTDHTPVEAGHEKFEPRHGTDINRMTYVLGAGGHHFRDKFVRVRDGVLIVDFSNALIELADIRNGVSKWHATRTARLFEGIFKEKEGKDKSINIIPVLNGSGDVWVNERLLKYQAAGTIPTEDELYEIHERAKVEQSLREVERRTGRKLDPARLTSWMVRRITEYKSQYPLLRFLVHIMCADTDEVFTKEKLMEIWERDILNHLESGTDRERAREREMPYYKTLQRDLPIILKSIFAGREKVNGLGMQMVIGGPEYEGHWVNEFKRWMDLPALKNRFVYVSDSDASLLKMQAIGADVCINMPRGLDEACGTSGQRTGRGGGVAISPIGMGDIEWITPYKPETQDGSGFIFESFIKEGPYGELEADLEKFYMEGPGVLLKEVATASGIYYRVGKDSNPDKSEWKRLMFNSYCASTYGAYIDKNGYLVKKKAVNAQAMAERYARDEFLPAIRIKSDTKTIDEMVIRDYCRYDESGRIKIPGLRNAVKELKAKVESGVKYLTIIGLMKHTGQPYEIVDPIDIDERAGTWKDLNIFLTTAHRLGIEVLPDWLANQHVAKTAPICKDRPDLFLYTNVSDGNYKVGTDLSAICKGRDLPFEELKIKIRNGERINEIIAEMAREGRELPREGFFDIEGGKVVGKEEKTSVEKIPYWIADEETRRNVLHMEITQRPVVVLEKDALFLASATDLIVLDKGYARRWASVAQPDLSHPDVISMAIDAGRFWLNKGFDGFRIDAALSNLPDRFKENWGIKLDDNLTVKFMREMRARNPHCFFLFEGFDRQKELLMLSDYRNCACYSWEARDYITEALQEGKMNRLIAYLKKLETEPREIRDNLVNMGPEHDNIDNGYPASKLSYRDRNLMYFVYMFIPGFRLIFDGEDYGSDYAYRNDITKTSPAPGVASANRSRMQVRQCMFLLPRYKKQMLNSAYRSLDFYNGERGNSVALARYDEQGIMIGALNFTQNSGWTTFDLKPLLDDQDRMSGKPAQYYKKTSHKLSSDGTSWVSGESRIITAKELYKIGVELGPKSCELIELTRVEVASDVEAPDESKGSPAQGLKYLYENKIFSGNSVTVKELALLRGYSDETARIELKDLVESGLVVEDKGGRAYKYYLTESLARAPPDKAKEAIEKIADTEIDDVKVLDLYTIPDNKRGAVNEIVGGIIAELPKDSARPLLQKAAALGEELSSHLDRDISNGLKALESTGPISAKLTAGRVYVVRVSRDRLSDVPYGISIVKAYVELLKLRAVDPKNIILKYSNKAGLVSVQSYKNKDDYNSNRILGEGQINIRGDLKSKQLDLVGLLNMAVAASNIRISLMAGQAYDDYEESLIALIRNQYEQIYGYALTVPDNKVLNFIKDLPPIDKPLPIDSIELYYRMTYQKLQQAA